MKLVLIGAVGAFVGWLAAAIYDYERNRNVTEKPDESEPWPWD